MSKPLTVALELIGAVVFFWSLVPPQNWSGVVIGAIMIIAGMIGVRKRKPTT